MAEDIFQVYNSAVPTTAMMTPVSTGTALKTLLQITAPSNHRMAIISWGITFDGAPSAIRVELINTLTVAGGTPTAVTPTNVADSTSPSVVTAGFSPGTEGTVAGVTRVYDTQILSTNNYVWEWALGREPVLPATHVLRVRVLAGVAVNALTWIRWAE